MEIRFGEFISVVELSGPVDLEKTKAEYEDGFLWVVLPKLKPTKVKPKE
jgi:HSP20 family molecular chaperone IbpA